MFPIPIGNDPAGSTIPVLVVPIAPPEKGRASKELASLLAEVFGVPARLAKGGASRRKLLLLEGIGRAEVQRILEELIHFHLSIDGNSAI